MPISIETRLSKLSLNEKVFNESITIYQKAHDKSDYKHQLKFQKTSTNDTNVDSEKGIYSGLTRRSVNP